LIEGLKSDLEGVKGIQSKHKLTWKKTILNATVSLSGEETANMLVRAFVRVLNTNPKNIYTAMKRR
jgi:hypothetical protein